MDPSRCPDCEASRPAEQQLRVAAWGVETLWLDREMDCYDPCQRCGRPADLFPLRPHFPALRYSESGFSSARLASEGVLLCSFCLDTTKD